MRRRDVIGLLAGAAVACPLAVVAQQSERMPTVGVLIPYSEGDSEAQSQMAAFRDALKILGLAPGEGLRLEERWADGDSGKLRTAARELVALAPDVIVSRSAAATAAILYETRTIPVVFLVISDPVGDGFALSMARPGGNATGFTNVAASLGGQWLELLKEMAPPMRRVAVLSGPNAPGDGSYFLPSIQAAASSKDVKVVALPIRDASAIGHEIGAFAREPDGALIVAPDLTTTVHRAAIISTASRHRLPAMYAFRHFATEGGLASYGIDIAEQHRSAADYVTRILRGEKPRDLPVQAPGKFDLVINLKTAHALGLALPPTLLARADEVIE